MEQDRGKKNYIYIYIYERKVNRLCHAILRNQDDVLALKIPVQISDFISASTPITYAGV